LTELDLLGERVKSAPPFGRTSAEVRAPGSLAALPCAPGIGTTDAGQLRQARGSKTLSTNGELFDGAVHGSWIDPVWPGYDKRPGTAGRLGVLAWLFRRRPSGRHAA
jgi:hypothetical protein